MFDKLAGNQRVKDLLRRLLKDGRIPGALLFAGEEGVGKKLFALEVARALNCRNHVDRVEACDVCPSCKRTGVFVLPSPEDKEANKRIIWSSHTDVGMARAPKRVILIDQIRDLEREANFRPNEGVARVFLVDDADKLNDESSNALLKTLEEPPATSHLILITSRPASLLSTIRSRCQTIRFAPLGVEELKKVVLETRTELSNEQALILARAARGSVGRALKTDLSQYIEQRDSMLAVLDALTLSPDTAQLLRSSEELNDAKVKDEYEQKLELLEVLIHDAWALKLSDAEAPVVNDDLREHLGRVASGIEIDRPMRWLSLIDNHRRRFEVNINRKVATDSLFLEMAGV